MTHGLDAFSFRIGQLFGGQGSLHFFLGLPSEQMKGRLQTETKQLKFIETIFKLPRLEFWKGEGPGLTGKQRSSWLPFLGVAEEEMRLPQKGLFG